MQGTDGKGEHGEQFLSGYRMKSAKIAFDVSNKIIEIISKARNEVNDLVEKNQDFLAPIDFAYTVMLTICRDIKVNVKIGTDTGLKVLCDDFDRYKAKVKEREEKNADVQPEE